MGRKLNGYSGCGTVGKHYIGHVGPVGRPTGSIDPVGRHYIGLVGHEAEF